MSRTAKVHYTDILALAPRSSKFGDEAKAYFLTCRRALEGELDWAFKQKPMGVDMRTILGALRREGRQRRNCGG
jgi:hypothetical protein